MQDKIDSILVDSSTVCCQPILYVYGCVAWPVSTLPSSESLLRAYSMPFPRPRGWPPRWLLVVTSLLMMSSLLGFGLLSPVSWRGTSPLWAATVISRLSTRGFWCGLLPVSRTSQGSCALCTGSLSLLAAEKRPYRICLSSSTSTNPQRTLLKVRRIPWSSPRAVSQAQSQGPIWRYCGYRGDGFSRLRAFSQHSKSDGGKGEWGVWCKHR